MSSSDTFLLKTKKGKQQNNMSKGQFKKKKKANGSRRPTKTSSLLASAELAQPQPRPRKVLGPPGGGELLRGERPPHLPWARLQKVYNRPVSQKAESKDPSK